MYSGSSSLYLISISIFSIISEKVATVLVLNILAISSNVNLVSKELTS